MIKEIKIGNVLLKNNVFLAPMAGVTDLAFRNICKRHNVGLTYTEMASSKALSYSDNKTNKILKIEENTYPNAIQIFGSDEDILCDIVKKLNERKEIDIIDINMGCPAPKIVKNGDGAALLKDLDKVERIIKKITEVSNKPITVKTRKGINDNNITAVKVAKICEKYGVAAITIHGRNLEQYYTGKADLDIIKQVKESVKIPVIGNGDIVDLESAKKMFEYTGCDGIMIGRGAEGNPWIFDEVIIGTKGKKDISKEELLQTILNHIDVSLKYEDERVVVLKMRKHIAWYLKGFPEFSELKKEIYLLSDINLVKQTLINNIR